MMVSNARAGIQLALCARVERCRSHACETDALEGGDAIELHRHAFSASSSQPRLKWFCRLQGCTIGRLAEGELPMRIQPCRVTRQRVHFFAAGTQEGAERGRRDVT